MMKLTFLVKRWSCMGLILISGAVVKPSRDCTRVSDINYTNVWTLTRSTFLQHVHPKVAIGRDDAPKCDLTPIHVIGVVIYKLPREWISLKDKQIRATELVVVDEGSFPVIVTL